MRTFNYYTLARFLQIGCIHLTSHQVATEPVIRKILYCLCVRTGAVLGFRRVALLCVACTFKQVGNSKTIGYFWLLAYSTNCIKSTFVPHILRPLA